MAAVRLWRAAATEDAARCARLVSVVRRAVAAPAARGRARGCHRPGRRRRRPAGRPTPAASAPTGALPLFAFYYIWFDPGSWDRAKIDYPQLGRYSSDDPRVMRQHIEWAKSAGIDGFIVSWKDTAINDRRLRLLMDVARQEDFKLALIYQGLDFDRNPLPVAQVAADFATFRHAVRRRSGVLPPRRQAADHLERHLGVHPRPGARR